MLDNLRGTLLAAAILAALAACGGSPPETAEAPEDEFLVYFGTYTRGGNSEGIYVSRFNAGTGELSEPELAAPIEDPSFLAFHPNGQFLYSVSELSEGTVSAFSIDRQSGKLALLNTQPTNGGAPCDLEVDQTSRMLVVANYGNGTVPVYPVNSDGSLGEMSDFKEHEGSSVNERRQQGPHAHSVDFSADNRFCLISDLGIDKVMIYRADPAAAKLEPNDPPFVELPPGSGPRHFAFHPTAPYAYSLGEMASTVTALNWDASNGSLDPIETVTTLPADFDGNNSTAEIEAHPTGRFLYASNRGHNSVAVFSVDGATGKLTLVENVSTQGETPRNFAIDPTGRYLLAANQNTSNVVVFTIDESTGKLTPTGRSINVGAPVCIKYLPVN